MNVLNHTAAYGIFFLVTVTMLLRITDVVESIFKSF